MSSMRPGVWAASLTPLNADLGVDHGALAEHVRRLLNTGCDGIAALGTTGEANSFSLAERMEVVEKLGALGIGAERMLVGVGSCAAPDTIALTRAVRAAGFTNVMMLPPFYYKPASDDGLFASYARIIDALNDPDLRVIIYDIPPMTGFSLSNALLRRLSDAYPEMVVGVKNSSGDWPSIDATLRELPGFLTFAGTEQFLVPNLRANGPGCISAFANISAPAVGRLYADWRGADADAAQARVAEARQRLKGHATIPALKEIVARDTGHDGWRRVRPPLLPLSTEAAAAVRATWPAA